MSRFWKWGGGRRLLNRIIPQIYNAEMYDIVKQVYPWKSIIYTLYRQEDVSEEEILAFAKEKKDISVITVPLDRVSESFCRKIHEIGKQVYTHTVNKEKEMQELRELGVEGFYTDKITPESYLKTYQMSKKRQWLGRLKEIIGI